MCEYMRKPYLSLNQVLRRVPHVRQSAGDGIPRAVARWGWKRGRMAVHWMVYLFWMFFWLWVAFWLLVASRKSQDFQGFSGFWLLLAFEHRAFVFPFPLHVPFPFRFPFPFPIPFPFPFPL